MQRLRRVTGFFVHLLMLHLILVGSGDACVLPAVVGAAQRAVLHTDTTPHGTPSTGAAAAHDMAGVRVATSPGPASAPCDETGGHAPAPHSTAPDCESMAPCASAALTAVAVDVDQVPTRVGDRGARLTVLPPASRATGPEPPPPRA